MTIVLSKDRKTLEYKDGKPISLIKRIFKGKPTISCGGISGFCFGAISSNFVKKKKYAMKKIIEDQNAK